MIDAARYRPIRIAPRLALAFRALDNLNAGWATAIVKRNRIEPVED